MVQVAFSVVQERRTSWRYTIGRTYTILLVEGIWIYDRRHIDDDTCRWHNAPYLRTIKMYNLPRDYRPSLRPIIVLSPTPFSFRSTHSFKILPGEAYPGLETPNPVHTISTYMHTVTHHYETPG